jgi:catechol 2,3-dioxygenase-like lactoylglutathione lyase family enzyme
MKYKFSRCFCIQTPNVEEAIEFYRTTMGLKLVRRDSEVIELAAGEFRFFLDQGTPLGTIMEYIVPNLEAAKEELLGAGCKVVSWGGKGKPCYMRDPFGMVFNLFEEP